MTMEVAAAMRQRYEVTYIYVVSQFASRLVRLTIQVWESTEWGTMNITFNMLSSDERTGERYFNPWRGRKLERLQLALGDALLQTKFGPGDEEVVMESNFPSVRDLIEYLKRKEFGVKRLQD